LCPEAMVPSPFRKIRNSFFFDYPQFSKTPPPSTQNQKPVLEAIFRSQFSKASFQKPVLEATFRSQFLKASFQKPVFRSHF